MDKNIILSVGVLTNVFNFNDRCTLCQLEKHKASFVPARTFEKLISEILLARNQLHKTGQICFLQWLQLGE